MGVLKWLAVLLCIKKPYVHDWPKLLSDTPCGLLMIMVMMQDMQAEKLKEQLRNTIMERKREAKKAFDMAGAWSKGAASRPAGRLSKKGDEATINVRPAAEGHSKPAFKEIEQ